MFDLLLFKQALNLLYIAIPHLDDFFVITCGHCIQKSYKISWLHQNNSKFL